MLTYNNPPPVRLRHPLATKIIHVPPIDDDDNTTVLNNELNPMTPPSDHPLGDPTRHACHHPQNPTPQLVWKSKCLFELTLPAKI